MPKILHTIPGMVFFILFSIAFSQPIFGQTQKPPTAQISGRVMMGDKPAPDVSVVLYPPDVVQARSVAQTATDADGRYSFSRLPSGRFKVSLVAPTFSIGESTADMYGRPGKSVLLSEGESVSGIDFSLAPGGVITGRVTDAEGKPVIGLSVSIAGSDPKTPVFRGGGTDPYLFQTDDRGIYRVYGIPNGKYIVSAGQSVSSGIMISGSTRAPLTYHPNVSDRSQAEVIDLSSGGESTGVDIQLGAPSQTFSVSGKFINAETGQPVPNTTVRYMTIRQENWGSSSLDAGLTDVKGLFKFDGLSPGQYGIYSQNNPGSPSSTYSDTTRFQIVDADVTDIEVKIHQGATVTGRVVFENSSDVKMSTLLQNLNVFAAPQQTTDTFQNQFRSSRVSEDGSFVITGLAPGPVLLNAGIYPQVTGLDVRRIEREGVLIPKSIINVNAGETIAGLRIIISIGSGSVRGTVTVGGLPIPAGMYVMLACKRLLTQTNVNTGQAGMLDARGQFLITGLTSGEYEIRVVGRFMHPQSEPQGPLEAKQTVTVGESGESQLLLDLKPLQPRGTP